ncbi:unnamed protein product [Adineta ricciae]|uniref:Uncharacterized protein n=1 Tax=Adineta ricciae TaxID=249248 RepID=A0A815AEI6_ADIRI|nr:unnamed protein product [Adineta ricciae]
MISKELSRLATIGVFMSFLIQYMASERLPASTLEMNANHKDSDAIGRYLWFRPTLYSDSNENIFEDGNGLREMSPLLSKLVSIYNEHDRNNRPDLLSSPVRRSNFWKRANFWRKRANFWRRDLSSQQNKQVM